MKNPVNRRAVLWALGCAVFCSLVELGLWVLSKAGQPVESLMWLFVLSLVPVLLYIWRTRLAKPFLFVAVKVCAGVVLFFAFAFLRPVQRLLAVFSLPSLSESDNVLGMIPVFLWGLHAVMDLLILLIGGIQSIRKREWVK